MAFSTQKDFFNVPFMNQTLELECRQACVKLKSYDSTIDDRSWAIDETKQSKFLSDLVTCNTPSPASGECPGDGDIGVGLGAVRGGSERAGTVSRGAVVPSTDVFMKGGDSVLECTNQNLVKLEELLNDKKSLQKQLAISKDRLKCSNAENDKIKSIVNKKFDNNLSKDFHNRIQKLSAAGKISKSEENDLLQIYYKFEDMNKAYEVSQAESMHLKRLIEKLSQRATMDSINVDPEKSTDIVYLQEQVNKLRKEVLLLRKYEDDKMRSKCNQKDITDRDATKINEIMAERNALREKCKTFKDLEVKVRDLQKKAREADNMSDNLSANLNNQSKYIGDMEGEMQRMQKYYEDQMQKLNYSDQILKCQIKELKEDLCRAQCKAQKSDCLQMEIGVLRNEVLKRELALGDYDCQYKQLMCIVDQLRGNTIQNLQDTETQTRDKYVEDLAFFASATLDEIMKELNKRGISPQSWPGTIPTTATRGYGTSLPAFVVEELRGYAIQNLQDTETQTCDEYVEDLAFFASATLDEIMKEFNKRGILPWPAKSPTPAIKDYDTPAPAVRPMARVSQMSPEDCCKEVERLQQLVRQLDDENNKLLHRTRMMDSGFERLQRDATVSKEVYQRQKRSLDNITELVNKMDLKLMEHGNDTGIIQKGLEESIQLVKDISDFQMKNQDLASAVNAITSRDDQKIIDDLRRQLQEEMDKNARLRQQNEDLRNLLQSRGLPVPFPVSPEAGGIAIRPDEPSVKPGLQGAKAMDTIPIPRESLAKLVEPVARPGELGVKPGLQGAKAMDTIPIPRESLAKLVEPVSRPGELGVKPGLQGAKAMETIPIPRESLAKLVEPVARPGELGVQGLQGAKPGEPGAAATPGQAVAAAPGQAAAAAPGQAAAATPGQAAAATPGQAAAATPGQAAAATPGQAAAAAPGQAAAATPGQAAAATPGQAAATTPGQAAAATPGQAAAAAPGQAAAATPGQAATPTPGQAAVATPGQAAAATPGQAAAATPGQAAAATPGQAAAATPGQAAAAAPGQAAAAAPGQAAAATPGQAAAATPGQAAAATPGQAAAATPGQAAAAASGQAAAATPGQAAAAKPGQPAGAEGAAAGAKPGQPGAAATPGQAAAATPGQAVAAAPGQAAAAAPGQAAAATPGQAAAAKPGQPAGAEGTAAGAKPGQPGAAATPGQAAAAAPGQAAAAKPGQSAGAEGAAAGAKPGQPGAAATPGQAASAAPGQAAAAAPGQAAAATPGQAAATAPGQAAATAPGQAAAGAPRQAAAAAPGQAAPATPGQAAAAGAKPGQPAGAEGAAAGAKPGQPGAAAAPGQAAAATPGQAAAAAPGQAAAATPGQAAAAAPGQAAAAAPGQAAAAAPGQAAGAATGQAAAATPGQAAAAAPGQAAAAAPGQAAAAASGQAAAAPPGQAAAATPGQAVGAEGVAAKAGQPAGEADDQLGAPGANLRQPVREKGAAAKAPVAQLGEDGLIAPDSDARSPASQNNLLPDSTGVEGVLSQLRFPQPTSASAPFKKRRLIPQEEKEAYEKFVDHNVDKIAVNLKAGNDLENEVRAILDTFIEECGYLFCRCTMPKSKFYALCHKIIHQGINTLSLKEILYLHKKISIAADKLKPGCLISMLFDEQSKSKYADDEDKKRKCCNCKSTLCCNNSEEMLKEKVLKLEKDIEIAKEYLDNCKTNPESTNRSQYTDEYEEFSGYSQPEIERNITYRPAKPLSKCSSKQLKQLKARIMKCSELAR